MPAPSPILRASEGKLRWIPLLMTDMVPCECNVCECPRWMDTRDNECDDCFDGNHVEKPRVP